MFIPFPSVSGPEGLGNRVDKSNRFLRLLLPLPPSPKVPGQQVTGQGTVTQHCLENQAVTNPRWETWTGIAAGPWELWPPMARDSHCHLLPPSTEGLLCFYMDFKSTLWCLYWYSKPCMKIWADPQRAQVIKKWLVSRWLYKLQPKLGSWNPKWSCFINSALHCLLCSIDSAWGNPVLFYS